MKHPCYHKNQHGLGPGNPVQCLRCGLVYSPDRSDAGPDGWVEPWTKVAMQRRERCLAILERGESSGGPPAERAGNAISRAISELHSWTITREESDVLLGLVRELESEIRAHTQEDGA